MEQCSHDDEADSRQPLCRYAVLGNPVTRFFSTRKLNVAGKLSEMRMRIRPV